jgi:tight adherence protein B
LTDVEAAISKAGIKVDAVALDQSRADQGPLRVMTSAGAGQVVPADPKALTQAFTEEADSLARQILVTAKVPAAVSAAEATIVVTAQSAAGTLRAESYSVIRGSSTIVPTAPGTPEASGIQIPKEAMYGGLAALGVGLLVLISSVMVAGTQGSLPKTVEQRIADYGSTGVVSTPGAAKAESRGSSLDQAKGAAASMLRHNRGLEARIEQRLEAAGSALKPAEWLLMHATIALICGLVGTLLLGNDFLSVLLFIGAGLLLPWLWLGHRRKRRIRAFNSGLADTLQLISGSLTAGMSFAQSLDSVVAEGHEPIAGEFKRVLVETRLGVPLEAALEGIAQRLESKDFAWVVMAIRIQRDVGGNLAELLNTVAGTLRERDYLRRQVKSLSAEGLLSAYILIALPICMLGYMLSFRRSYIMPMFTDPMGLMMLAVAVVLLLLGWFMMSRIVKVEI